MPKADPTPAFTMSAEGTQRLLALGHSLQSGVAAEMAVAQGHAQRHGPSEPKHLRTGIDTLFAQFSGLAVLLVTKGFITPEEYEAAMIQAMEEEVKRYEAQLSDALGKDVTLI
jgi:hypothetical protein